MGVKNDVHREIEADLDFEFVQLSVRLALPPSPLLTASQQAKRVEIELKKKCKEWRIKIANGFALCLNVAQELFGEEGLESKMILQEQFAQLTSKEATEQIADKIIRGASCKELLNIPHRVLNILYKSAKVLLERSLNSEAQAAFWALVFFHHTSYPLWLGLGISSFNLQEYTLALRVFQEAHKLWPQESSLYLYQANCMRALGEIGAAKQLIDCSNQSKKGKSL